MLSRSYGEQHTGSRLGTDRECAAAPSPAGVADAAGKATSALKQAPRACRSAEATTWRRSRYDII